MKLNKFGQKLSQSTDLTPFLKIIKGYNREIEREKANPPIKMTKVFGVDVGTIDKNSLVLGGDKILIRLLELCLYSPFNYIYPELCFEAIRATIVRISDFMLEKGIEEEANKERSDNLYYSVKFEGEDYTIKLLNVLSFFIEKGIKSSVFDLKGVKDREDYVKYLVRTVNKFPIHPQLISENPSIVDKQNPARNLEIYSIMCIANSIHDPDVADDIVLALCKEHNKMNFSVKDLITIHNKHLKNKVAIHI